MRGRQRHFNPAGAGATLALHGRSLTSGSIGSWDGLPGTSVSATQGVGANQPTVGTLNGVPAAVFDGSNDHLTIASFSSLVTTGATLIIAVRSESGNECSWFTTGGDHWDRWHGDWTSYLATFLASARYNSLDSPGSGVIQSIVSLVAGTTLQRWFSGVAGTLKTSHTFGCIASDAIIGARSDLFFAGFLNGKIGAIYMIPSVVSDALRRRIEQSLALSFRIACA
jgi:hypothetical protein